jgi:hypothetical protein
VDDFEIDLEVSEFCGRLFLEGSRCVDVQNKKVNPNGTLVFELFAFLKL